MDDRVVPRKVDVAETVCCRVDALHARGGFGRLVRVVPPGKTPLLCFDLFGIGDGDRQFENSKSQTREQQMPN